MKELFLLYCSTRSISLRNTLVRHNIGLARKVAHNAAERCVEPYNDLEQIATIGLIKAVERYEPKLGKYFTSFALPYVRGEIQHYLRDRASAVRIPRGLHELSVKEDNLRAKLSCKLGRSPSDEEVASILNQPISIIDETKIARKNLWKHWSLDAVASDSDNDNLTLAGTLVAKNTPLQKVSVESLIKQLEQAIASCSPKTRLALKTYFKNGQLPHHVVDELVNAADWSLTEVVEAIAELDDKQIKNAWQQAIAIIPKQLHQWFSRWLKRNAA